MDSGLRLMSDERPVRIVAGELGGRRLVAPKGASTRPTADKVREALFSILFDVEGLRTLDLYAGSGAVGLEALSRGAAHATFVERGRPALLALEQNIAELGVGARTEVRREDVLAALPRLAAGGRSFELIFADPPYDEAARALPSVLRRAAPLLAPDGQIICEHRSLDASPPAPEGLVRIDARRYGEATLAFYAPSA